MTDNELRKLKRTDLLELLLAQEKENEDLRRQLQEAQDRLEERKLALEEAGSIAEASLRLSGVFEAAQTAADQYLENVRRLSEGQETRCARLEEEGRRSGDTELARACDTLADYLRGLRMPAADLALIEAAQELIAPIKDFIALPDKEAHLSEFCAEITDRIGAVEERLTMGEM